VVWTRPSNVVYSQVVYFIRRFFVSVVAALVVASCDRSAVHVDVAVDADSPYDVVALVDKPSPRDIVSPPDVSPPDVSLPDVSLPDVSMPDASMPDVSMPDVVVSIDSPSDSNPDVRIFIPTHDLDGDGILESRVGRAMCDDQMCVSIERPGGSCITRFGDGTAFEAILRGAQRSPVLFIQGDRAMDTIGDHTGDGVAEIAVFYATRVSVDRWVPTLAVLDGATCDVDARVRPPEGLQDYGPNYNVSAWAGYARRGTRLHPFLMPSIGDGETAARVGTAGPWGYGCVYDRPRTAATGGACGNRFVTVGTTSSRTGVTGLPWFREVGGLVYDVNGDGADEIHLVYHERLLTISFVEPLRLAETLYDSATGAMPTLFHGGRTYGPVSMRREGSVVRTSIVSGANVGDFDSYCSVSRFVAVLEHPVGAVSSRALARAEYLSFTTPIPGRIGQLIDRCVHRPYDARVRMAGHDAVLFNIYRANARTDGLTCANSDGTPVAAFRECADRYARSSTGRWNVEVRAIDGAGTTLPQLGGVAGAYVWGIAEDVHPLGPVVVLEMWPGDTSFDITSTRGTISLHVISSTATAWIAQPVAVADLTRPALLSATPDGAIGAGSQTHISRVRTDDRNHNGVREIVFNDGRTFEWNGTAFAR
jgi:hypothetical protein